MERTRRLLWLAVAVIPVLTAYADESRTARSVTASPSHAPADTMVIGEFVDDYDNRYTISASEWLQHPRGRYLVRRWNDADQYLIAQNDSANARDGGRWTRIDWLPLSGMAPYTWGFCLSAYRAPTAVAAESTRVARRDTPKTGCNGFPFSRMRRITP